MNKQKIENVLLKIGIPASLKGFKYIIDAVMIIDEFGLRSVTKNLYPDVAKINGTTASRVERAIRHALELTRSRKGDPEVINHYIGFENVQNSNSLSMLHLRIKEEQEIEQENNDKLDKIIRRIVKEELKNKYGGIANE